jgi:hypothetical protein
MTTAPTTRRPEAERPQACCRRFYSPGHAPGLFLVVSLRPSSVLKRFSEHDIEEKDVAANESVCLGFALWNPYKAIRECR